MENVGPTKAEFFDENAGPKKAILKRFFDENVEPRKAVLAMKLMLLTRCSATRKWGTVDGMVAVSLASEVLLMGCVAVP